MRQHALLRMYVDCVSSSFNPRTKEEEGGPPKYGLLSLLLLLPNDSLGSPETASQYGYVVTSR